MGVDGNEILSQDRARCTCDLLVMLISAAMCVANLVISVPFSVRTTTQSDMASGIKERTSRHETNVKLSPVTEVYTHILFCVFVCEPPLHSRISIFTTLHCI